MIAGYVVMHLTLQHPFSSQYSVLQPDALVSKDKAFGSGGIAAEDAVFSREASLTDKQLTLAECGGGTGGVNSRGGSFSGAARQQGGMHMRSDSANDESIRVSIAPSVE